MDDVRFIDEAVTVASEDWDRVEGMLMASPPDPRFTRVHSVTSPPGIPWDDVTRYTPLKDLVEAQEMARDGSIGWGNEPNQWSPPRPATDNVLPKEWTDYDDPPISWVQTSTMSPVEDYKSGIIAQTTGSPGGSIEKTCEDEIRNPRRITDMVGEIQRSGYLAVKAAPEPPEERGHSVWIWMSGHMNIPSWRTARFDNSDPFASPVEVVVPIGWGMASSPTLGACLRNTFGTEITANTVLDLATERMDGFSIKGQA